jgi:uncharacterized membrane protein YccC
MPRDPGCTPASSGQSGPLSVPPASGPQARVEFAVGAAAAPGCEQAQGVQEVRRGITPANAAAAWAPALVYGLRVSASVCLALLIAFWLQLDDAYWAATSAAIVAQPALGASLRKGRFRIIGTIAGGVAIVLLTAAFPQNHAALLVSIALWAALCAFLATVLPNFAGYGAALAGYTAAIVFGDMIANPQNVFMITVWRTTEIGIGILSAGLVHALTDFGNARHRLARQLSDIGGGIASGLAETLRAGEEALRFTTARRELIGRVIGLDAIIDEAIGEPSHLRHYGGRMQALMEALFVALSAWRGVGTHLGTLSPSARAGSIAVLLPSVAAVADREWSSHPEEIGALCRRERCRVQQMSAAGVSGRLLVDAVGRMLGALEAVGDGLNVVTGASGEPPQRSRTRPYVADLRPATLNALRVALAMGCAELFWIASGWPSGPTMIIFTAVAIILKSREADAAYLQAVEFAMGCALAAALAVILDLAVLPSLRGGAAPLSVALSLVLAPLAALSMGPWRKAMFAAAFTNLMPILALENEPIYDAARVFNAAIAVGAGCVLGAVFFRLLPPIPPRLRIERLLRLSLRDLRALAGGRRRFSQEAWLRLLSQRLAAMPKEATLEQEAELLATLSVGEAAVALRSAIGGSADSDSLDRALTYLAEGEVAQARERFAHFALRQSELQLTEHRPGMEAAVQATLIADALGQHRQYFSAVP